MKPLPLLTVVNSQNLPTVHFDEAAQRELGVADAQLRGPFKGHSLQTKPDRLAHAATPTHSHTHTLRQVWSRAHLVVVVVHQASYDVRPLWIQLRQHVGRVGGEVDQLLLGHNLGVVLRLNVDVLHSTQHPTNQYDMNKLLALNIFSVVIISSERLMDTIVCWELFIL